jgi:hypothetical protein
VLLDQGAQGFLPGVLAPQLLGLCLDPLAVALDLLDLALQLFHPQFVLHLALLVLQHAQLVARIPSPVEHRQKLSPPRQR